MDTKDILTLVSIIVAALIGIIGFALTIWQINKAKRVKEMDFVSNLISAIRTNERLSDAFYLIEYDKKWYDEKFKKSKIEKKMDALLSQLDYLCYARETKLIREEAFNYFGYTLYRVVNNKEARNYFWNLYHLAKLLNQECPFAHLINYMKQGFSVEELFAFNSKEVVCEPYRKVIEELKE